MKRLLTCLFLIGSLYGNVTVDLREPEIENGVVTTTKGGVIQACRFRLQAETIRYTKNKEAHLVDAVGFVMVDFGDYLFIGDSLHYDFNEEQGYIEKIGRAHV